MKITDDPAQLRALLAIQREGRLVEERPDTLSEGVGDANHGVKRRLRMGSIQHPAQCFRRHTRRRRDCVLSAPARIDGGTQPLTPTHDPNVLQCHSAIH